jgi:glycosidase
MGLLFTLQGIPCVYYGTEQGLTGIGYGGDEAVREALWGKPNAFDQSHAYYGAIAALAKSRREHAALRYGRQYFRPISGDGIHFGVSPYEGGGVLAFSRILNKTELLVLANTQTDQDWSGSVIIDYFLNNEGDKYQVLYSNKTTYAEPGQVKSVAGADVTVQEVNGSVNHGGSLRVIPVTLKSMEIQVLGKPAADN